jgi:hypothetical protein
MVFQGHRPRNGALVAGSEFTARSVKVVTSGRTPAAPLGYKARS